MKQALQFRLDILIKELDILDSAIRKIDDIGSSIKNWAIVVWTGSIAVILGRPELHQIVGLTAIPPLLFLIVDTYWRRNQRRFIYRQGEIRDFLNSEALDQAFETGSLDFTVLDPMARYSHGERDYRRFTSIRRVLGFPTVSFLYVGLSLLSLALATAVSVNQTRTDSMPCVVEEVEDARP